jgi:hypothetical protein
MQHSSEQFRFHDGETQGPFHHHVCQKSDQDKQHSWHCTRYATQVFQDPMDCPKRAHPPSQTAKKSVTTQLISQYEWTG